MPRFLHQHHRPNHSSLPLLHTSHTQSTHFTFQFDGNIGAVQLETQACVGQWFFGATYGGWYVFFLKPTVLTDAERCAPVDLPSTSQLHILRSYHCDKGIKHTFLNSSSLLIQLLGPLSCKNLCNLLDQKLSQGWAEHLYGR